MLSMLSNFIDVLTHSPIDAVESHEFLHFCNKSRDFYRHLPVECRWRLLHALDVSRLDYQSILPLDDTWIELPESLGKVSWQEVLETLYCDDFIL